MKNINVPYKSQHDQDARRTANDCGPASIAMILNYYGESVTTDEVFLRTGADQGLIGISEMKSAIEYYGYGYSRPLKQTPDDIKKYIDQDIPVIALVKYGSLKSVQDKTFKGGHFFVVVGYREDGYFVNDPNFKDPLRSDGDHHFFTKEEFEKSWSDASKDGNQPNSLIVIHRKKEGGGDMAKKKYTEEEMTLVREERDKNYNELSKKIEEIKKLESDIHSKNNEIRLLKEEIDEMSSVIYEIQDEINVKLDVINEKETKIKILEGDLEVERNKKSVNFEDLKKRFLSRKFLLAVAGFIVPILNEGFGLNISVETMIISLTALVSFMAVEGYTDHAVRTGN